MKGRCEKKSGDKRKGVGRGVGMKGRCGKES